MSNPRFSDFPSDLIDLHFGQLDEPRAAEVRARIAADSTFAEAAAQLEATLGALRSWQVSAPGDLSERLNDRLADAIAHTPRVRVGRRLAAEVEGQDRQPVVLRMGNLRDVIAVAAVIVLAVGLGVPGLLNMRARTYRIGCSQNLALLGQGLQQYAQTYASSLPFAGRNGGARLAGADAGADAPNRAHVFPLLQEAFVSDPRVFICPSRTDVPLSRQALATVQTFPEARNLSYAYFNMAGVRPSADDDAALPILSDDNPLFENGVPLLNLSRLVGGDATRINSRAHRGAGQNVLSLDGHVRFATTPLVGLDNDNIWTLQYPADYANHEGPRTVRDAHLIK